MRYGKPVGMLTDAQRAHFQPQDERLERAARAWWESARREGFAPSAPSWEESTVAARRAVRAYILNKGF